MIFTQKCPICEGHGLVEAGFYQHSAGSEYMTSNCAEETCRSCSGTGIIYVEQADYLIGQAAEQGYIV